MPPTAPSRRTDDFDMAKLQKSLKQRHRHSIQARPHVVKLTPAEIRSLSYAATASQAASNASSKRASECTRRLSNTTPPAPADSPTAYQTQISRASTINLPTPPATPTQSGFNQSHSNSHHPGHIHQPRPRPSKQADFLIANGLQSRRSSASTSSSVRSLPMYRGHEVTRTGSLTMLQRPAQDIVANPLSVYSRPRQPTINSAPDPRCDLLDMDPYQAQAMLAADDGDDDGDDDVKPVEQERQSSPIRKTESPVSFEETKPADAEKMPFVEKEQSSHSDDLTETVPDKPTVPNVAMKQELQQIDDAPFVEPAAVAQSGANAITKKTPKKRFTFHTGLLEKKGKDTAIPTQKNRRRTTSFTRSANDTTQITDTNSFDIKQTTPESSGDEIFAHPAVRPLSPNSTRQRSSSNTNSIIPSPTDSTHTNPFLPATEKGKTALTSLVVPTGPVYGRCACCGRIKRPNGFAAELSPVLENENIRTNFNLEVGRPMTNHSSGSHDTTKPRRYTPIIPMEVQDEAREGSIKTVQASIEPILEEHEIKARNEARKKRNSDSPKIVRFSSLHRPDVEQEKIVPKDEEIVASTPVVDPTIRPKNSIAIGAMNDALSSRESFDTMSTASIATARPISMTALRTPLNADLPMRPVTMFNTGKAPSEGSGKTASAGPRSGLIEQWYETAIRQGPKQDVITVVGWDRKSKKVDSQAATNGHAVEPGKASSVKETDAYEAIPSKASSVKETSPYEAQKAMNGHLISPTAAPTTESNKDSKRKSLFPGGLFKKLVPSTNSEGTKATTSSSTLQPPSRLSMLESNDSAISMSGANGFITAPTCQNNTQPASATAHHQTTVGPAEPVMAETKFKQYSPSEDKKGHVPKLSLGLGGDDMSLNLGLPTPRLGPHFARSNATLRDLVLAQSTPDSEKELEMAMTDEQKGPVEIKA